MALNGYALVRAVSDGDDQLISADEPLAGLQRRCGGELPGTIAVPALLETVRKARRFRLKLARALSAQDGTHAVTAWVEVNPHEDGDAGCDILLRNWRSAPLPPSDPVLTAGLHYEIDRQLAELTARLDAGQRVLTVEAEAADLAPLAKAMQQGIGRPWTEFVTLEGNGHHQPMHWRLVDGMTLAVAGSNRSWQATLVPQEAPGGDPIGFELLLTAREPLHLVPPPISVGGEASVSPFGTVGREIAPVLRQPIARIIANAETIRTRLAGPLAKEYADYAADIAAAGQHLLGLVEDLSDLEVVEAADFTVAADSIDLAEVARQAAGILGVRSSEKNMLVDMPQPGETLPAVAEFRRVLQILLNLIGNAIHYSPRGSRIAVRLERAGAAARAIVADQGPGLNAEDQAKVFEKFERLGRSGDGGSGLGLYISRRLARAMGGDLTVESTPGEGARFILELPADPSARNAGDLPEASQPFPERGFRSRLPRIPAARSVEGGSTVPSEPDQD